MGSLTPHCDHTGCVTCGDEAIAMEVLRVDEERALALCADAAGGHGTVETALVAPVRVGESLLVHAGTAIGRDSGRGVVA